MAKLDTPVIFILHDVVYKLILSCYCVIFFKKHFYPAVYCCLKFLLAAFNLSFAVLFMALHLCLSFYRWWHLCVHLLPLKCWGDRREISGSADEEVVRTCGFVLMRLSSAWCYDADTVSGREWFRAAINAFLSSRAPKVLKEKVWIWCNVYWSHDTEYNIDNNKRFLFALRLETVMQLFVLLCIFF